MLAACRAALWQSLDAAAPTLQTEFGRPRVANWQRRPAGDQITFSAVGLTTMASIGWVNRPTFQRVVQIGSLTI